MPKLFSLLHEKFEHLPVNKQQSKLFASLVVCLFVCLLERGQIRASTEASQLTSFLRTAASLVFYLTSLDANIYMYIYVLLIPYERVGGNEEGRLSSTGQTYETLLV